MFAVEMRNITKRFGHLTANDSVNFNVKKGEIHALVGENGAGKTTLMNILYGLYQPDDGEIFINHTLQRINSPRDAIKLGIGMVHQHFMLIPPLTILENIILGDEPLLRLNKIDFKLAEQTITELCENFSIKLNPNLTIESLSVGLQQKVEILKILYRKANILIFDEPTPVLTPQEVEELFSILNNLKKQGKTVILITHKLSEVMSISDNITIMRHGKVIETVETKSTNQYDVAKKMIGEDLHSVKKVEVSDSKSPVLEVFNLSALNDRNQVAFKEVTFKVNKYEILGIAAVEGNGQNELVEVLTGLRKKKEGKIIIDGKEIIDSRSIKISHIPEDRLKHGLVKEFSLSENLILGKHRDKSFQNFFLFSKKNIATYASKLIQTYDIRPHAQEQSTLTFSGGNQQKAVIARELSKNTPLIIAVKPTRGLDIKATNFVHDALLTERMKGKGILLVSSDLDELLLLSDRICVMYNGKIVATMKTNETNERELGLYMTGTRKMTSYITS